MPAAGLIVGCQSMGCIRVSNWDEGLNFHFRMMVHMRATPAIQAAMTMSTVTVVLRLELLEGCPVDVADAAPAAVLVTKMADTLRLLVVVTIAGVWATTAGTETVVDREDVEEEDAPLLVDEAAEEDPETVVRSVALAPASVSAGGLAWSVVVVGTLPGGALDAGGLFGSAGAGSAPPPMTGIRGSARSIKGERFLIRRFRLPCRRLTSMEA